VDHPQGPAEPPRIFLASGSPRRHQLFQLLDIPHQVEIPDVDERNITAKAPREYALKTAFAKACALDDRVPRGSIVVAADTIVVLDNDTLLKPEDEDDAFRILRKISGRTHHVISALAVRETGSATALDSVTTEVKIRAVTDDEIREYIATGEPMDKAGAYGIQGMGGRLVERVTGDYFTVVGLPIDKLLQMLAAHIDITPFHEPRRRLTPEIFAALQ
jgi:septum formation protein